MSLPAPTSPLLDDLDAFIRRFVVLPDDQTRIAVSLWVLHTWAFEAAHATPYLAVLSPEKRSGKTRLLEVLELLVNKPWRAANVSAAVLYRRIDRERPTLLLDEVDAIFTRTGDVNETLRGIINAGNRPNSPISRCAGDDHEPRDYSPYCAKVLAGIDNGQLPDTIFDRSIPIRMQRKRPEETTERFIQRRIQPDAEMLTTRAHEWAAENVDALRDADPDVPETLSDRALEAWEPLLAIAELAGPQVALAARFAAETLESDRDADEDNVLVVLLAAIRDAMQERAEISSVQLCYDLTRDPELPFRTYDRGRAMTAQQLAGLLKPCGIRPATIRINGNPNQRGYRREWFEDTWSRYLPDPSPAPADPPQPPRRHNELSTISRQKQRAQCPDPTPISDITSNS